MDKILSEACRVCRLLVATSTLLVSFMCIHAGVPPQMGDFMEFPVSSLYTAYSNMYSMQDFLLPRSAIVQGHAQ
jgi:hypothetical protein